MMNNTTEPRLGDYVRTERNLHTGRVYALHHSCPEQGEDWRRIQLDAGNVTEDQFESERWVSVLVHTGGAVTVPISDVTVIRPFNFLNSSAEKYFRD
jgi:hypothetical protein